MIPCQTVSEELWDWIQTGTSHTLDASLREHVDACPACRQAMDEARSARTGLGALRELAPLGFEAALHERLDVLKRTGRDPLAGRFEEDCFLAEETAPTPALLVDRRSPAWWRPVGLVAAGAVAVMVLGLVSRWTGQPVDGPLPVAPAPIATLEAPVAKVPTATDSLSASPDGGRTGLLAERPYDGADSTEEAAAKPESRERLTPVKVSP